VFRVRFSGFKVRVVVELSMGVGAGGEGRPPDSGKTPINFRQNGKKFGQKRKKRCKKKIKNAGQRKQKNCPPFIPGTAAACTGFLEEELETRTVEIYV